MHDDVLLISFTTKRPHIQNANVSQRTGIEKNTSNKMWKKRAETTWERGMVVKLISKTSSCRRPIGVRDSVHVADVDMT